MASPFIHKANKNNLHLKYFIISLLFGIIISLLLFELSFKIKNLVPITIVNAKEPVTELYFEDHLNLPKTVELLNTYEFSFRIHNLENTTNTYRYRITASSDKATSVIGEGRVLLQHDESRSIPQPLVITEEFSGRIFVELLNRDQNIHFYLETDI